MVAVAQFHLGLVNRNVPEFRKGVHRSDLPVLPPAEARRREVGVGAPASGRNGFPDGGLGGSSLSFLFSVGL